MGACFRLLYAVCHAFFFFVLSTCDLATRSKLPERVAQSHKRSDALHASDLSPFISSQGPKKKKKWCIQVWEDFAVVQKWLWGLWLGNGESASIRQCLVITGRPMGPGPQAMSIPVVWCCDVL